MLLLEKSPVNILCSVSVMSPPHAVCLTLLLPDSMEQLRTPADGMSRIPNGLQSLSCPQPSTLHRYTALLRGWCNLNANLNLCAQPRASDGIDPVSEREFMISYRTVACLLVGIGPQTLGKDRTLVLYKVSDCQLVTANRQMRTLQSTFV